MATMVVVFAAGLAACGSSASTSTTTTTLAPSGSTTATGPLGSSCSNSAIQGELYRKGVLTVATDNPVYTPWFVNNHP